jgi:hypothetical protein
VSRHHDQQTRNYLAYLRFEVRNVRVYLADLADLGGRCCAADLAAEHKAPGAREQLTKGLKHWLTTDLYMERRTLMVAVPNNTKPVIVN